MGDQTAMTIASLSSKQNLRISFGDNIIVDLLEKIEMFKGTFRKVLGEECFEGLALVDAVQRLGVDYHFRNEIEEILQRQYRMMISTDRYVQCRDDHGLREVALRFRLLRQEGYNVDADIFNKFRNKDGKFNEKISEDIEGLMSLYEASHLNTEGENLLEEAREYSANLLNEYVKDLDCHQANVVKSTLRYPHHKSLARLTAKTSYLNDFLNGNRWINVLQELAEMDFNMVQSLHREEIVQVIKWWKELGLAKELNFARDQPLKWYIWSMVTLTDPSLSEERIDLTKPISLVYIIDDIYDVHGTLDELTLFTETITRWDLTAMVHLPDYMKTCFKVLNNITDEISNKVAEKHGHNPLYSLRKAWSNLCEAFLVEAKWFASGYLPKCEEYLENGIISSGVHVGIVHIFYLLGQSINEETVELFDNIPPLISSTATILRLFDDLGSAKDENQDGNDGSYIRYYMKEHKDYGGNFALKHVADKISKAWKHLNKECLYPNPYSKSLTRACLNIARMVPLMYDYDDNQRLPRLEGYIKSLLFEGVPTQGVYD